MFEQGARPGLGYDGSELEVGLRLIGDLLTTQNTSRGGWLSPIYGPDNVFENDVFVIRAYCWCGGDQHPDGCPANFVHYASGLTVNWYKYVGRGMTVDRPFHAAEWAQVVWDCIRSIDPARPADSGGTGPAVEPQRMEALLRWLEEEGHITPLGSRQVMKIVDAWADAGAESSHENT